MDGTEASVSSTIAVRLSGSLVSRMVLDLLVDEDITLGTVRVTDGPDVVVCGHDGGRWIAWRWGNPGTYVIGESLTHALLEIGLEGVVSDSMEWGGVRDS